MKKLIVVLCVLALASLTGCSKVNMSAEYRALLRNTRAMSAELANRAEAGELTEDKKTEALRWNADRWQDFVNAERGVE